jgi:ABC-type multidrug transport system permease subunit
MYYIDPCNYLMSSLLFFTTWDKQIHCKDNELAIFDPPCGQTCGGYLSVYQQGIGVGTNLLNLDDTSSCHVCQYTDGGDYLQTLNLESYFYGGRNAGVEVEFVVDFYGLVVFMMKLRIKAIKKAES